MTLDCSIQIMIVDDSPWLRGITAYVLKNCGYSNIIGAHAAEAIDMLKKQNDISLIIAEWGMKPLTGPEFLKTVHGITPTPLIVTTTRIGCLKGIVKPAQEAGANYILPPNYDASKMMQAISVALAEPPLRIDAQKPNGRAHGVLQLGQD